VDLVPPVTILRAQANKLGQLTKGILEAEVTTVTGDEDFAVHRLDLLAPALDDRRVRVLTATHRADYYPLQLEAECFRPKRPPLAAPAPVPPPDLLPEPREWPRKNDWRPVVANQ